MLKLYSNTRRLLMLVIIASMIIPICLMSPAMAQTKIQDFVTDEEETEEAFEEYFEKMHSAAPGVDWEKMDQQTREEAYQEYLKSMKKSSLKTSAKLAAAPSTTETLANGKLTGQWKERGATNMAGNNNYADYWQATNTLYATSAGGNVWKAGINGSNWTCLNDFYKFKSANFIKVIPNGTGKRIFVSTGDKYAYYSDDDGATWNQSTGLDIIQNWGWILKTEMLADASNTLYVLAIEWTNTTVVSIYRSTDKGTSFSKLRSWSMDYNFADQNKFNIWAPTNTSHNAAYVVSMDSVFAIPNTGTTVQGLAKHNLTMTNDAHFTGCKSGSAITLYLYTNNSLYRSTNNGSSWLTLNMPSSNAPARTYSISTGLNDPNRIYYGDVEAYSGVFNTTTNQVAWTQVNSWTDYYGNMANKLHADISYVGSALNSSNAEFQFICTDGGIYTSQNFLGTVSNITLNGMNNAQYYSVYTDRNNLNYIYAGSQDQGFQQATTDAGGLLNVTQLVSGDDGRTVSTDNNSFWHVDYGALWYYPNATDASNTAYYSLGGVGRLWMPFIVEHPTNGSMMYMGGGKTDTDPSVKIYKFTYNAGSITMTALPFDFAPSSGASNISSIAISKINNNYWYVLTDNGKFYYSTDGGTSFTMCTDPNFAGLTGQYFYGSSIYASKYTLGTIYIAGSGYSSPGAYVSTDHGQTFTSITVGLPSTLVYDITANDNESMIFAATEVGPYVYVVADNQWYSMRGTTGSDQLYWDVEFISQNQTVRYGTYGRGIWDFQIQAGPVAVAITSPASGAVFQAPANITVTANASSSSSTISKVEFYVNGVLKSTSNTSPYTYTLSGATSGNYTLTAKAYDAANNFSTSSPVTIRVDNAPTVSIISPAANATVTGPNVTFTVNASDNDGSVVKVEYFRGGNGGGLIGTSTTSPFSFTWINAPNGTFTVYAVATDNDGITGSTTTQYITVVAPTCTAQQWNPTTAYVGEDIVQYNGIKYQAWYWTQNQEPDLHNGSQSTGQPWYSLGPCNGSVSPCSAPAWSATTTYIAGDVAEFNGVKYQAWYWTQNQEPDLYYGPQSSGLPWNNLGACTSKMAAFAESVNNLNIAPNPTDNFSSLNFSISGSDEVDLYVVDQLGNRVQSIFKGSLTDGEHQFTITSSSLNSGIYNVIIQGSNGVKTVRFIKK